MEIDNRICEVVRTCLKEEWKVDEVTDDMVKQQIEMALMVTVMHDTDLFELPKTSNALGSYLREISVYVPEEDSEESIKDDVSEA